MAIQPNITFYYIVLLYQVSIRDIIWNSNNSKPSNFHVCIIIGKTDRFLFFIFIFIFNQITWKSKDGIRVGYNFSNTIDIARTGGCNVHYSDWVMHCVHLMKFNRKKVVILKLFRKCKTQTLQFLKMINGEMKLLEIWCVLFQSRFFQHTEYWFGRDVYGLWEWRYC